MTNATVNEPVSGYEGLKTKEAIASLSSRSQVELAEIESYEHAHQNRLSVFDKLRWLRQDEPLPGYDALSSSEVRPRSRGPISRRSSGCADTSASSTPVARSWTRWTASIESAGFRSSPATPNAEEGRLFLMDADQSTVFGELQPEHCQQHTRQLIDRVPAKRELSRCLSIARYHRERRDLYRAKMHGPRPTSPVRLRELERAFALSDSRLRRAEQEHEPS